MTVTVPDVMRHVRHLYPADVLQREWRTEGGVLYPTDQAPANCWIAICESGPIGIYQLDESAHCAALPDSRWTGPVYTLNPPEDFLRLCQTIADWAARHENGIAEEKIGDYSASCAPSWQQAFAAALHPYMRMFQEVQA